MELPLTLMAGLVVGLAAALPPVACLRARGPAVSRGIVAMLVSFALLSGAIVLARMLASTRLPFFAVSAVLAFLTTVVTSVLRGERRR